MFTFRCNLCSIKLLTVLFSMVMSDPIFWNNCRQENETVTCIDSDLARIHELGRYFDGSSINRLRLDLLKNLEVISKEDFDWIPNIQEVIISNSRLSRIRWSTFNGLNNLTKIELTGNKELRKLDWQSFIGLKLEQFKTHKIHKNVKEARKKTQLIFDTENIICDCSQRWLLRSAAEEGKLVKYPSMDREETIPKYATKSSTYFDPTKKNRSIQKVFRLPETVFRGSREDIMKCHLKLSSRNCMSFAGIDMSTNQRMTESLSPNAPLELKCQISGDMLFETSESPTADRFVHFVGANSTEFHQNALIFFLANRSITGNYVTIQITVPKLDFGMLGWIYCTSLYSFMPEYDAYPLHFETPPHFLKARTNIEDRLFIGFTFVGFTGFEGTDRYRLWKTTKSINSNKTEQTESELLYPSSSQLTRNSSVHPHVKLIQNPIPRVEEIEFYKKEIYVLIHFKGFRTHPFEGEYTLEACNRNGCDNGTQQVSLPSQEPVIIIPGKSSKRNLPGEEPRMEKEGGLTPFNVLFMILVTVVPLVLLILLFIGLWQIKRLQKKKKEAVRRRMLTELDLTRDEVIPLQVRNQTYMITLLSERIPFIEFSKLNIAEEIGEGAFGKVYSASMLPLSSDNLVNRFFGDGGAPRKVAVKTLKQFSAQNLIKFEQEAELLSRLDHPNIVKFLGISVESTDLLLIFEFMDLGDLKTYLRERNPETQYVSRVPKPPIKFEEQLNITVQIANGLAYLATLRIVHRDLASRNCLLSSQSSGFPKVKLSDFGMSKDVYSIEYYRIHHRQAALPVRWLPPESLSFGKFSKETDIWSYGILVWEIFARGLLPYPHLSNPQVVAAVSEGILPMRPQGCPDNIWELLLACWRYEPESRIEISELERSLKRIEKSNSKTAPSFSV